MAQAVPRRQKASGMSGWTHSICDPCWKKREPVRIPVRIRHDPADAPNQEHCCFCGNHHSSGIYVRQRPTFTPCKGQGPEHEEEE